ncbi:MAG: D-aminoacyl-tRNA deacylase [Flavobacteriia bacterium]|nr:D-aminoacyl-tRNA deacylase [Flavobacteriia bacterium]
MRVVIQRVREASVKINDEIVGEIQQGLLVLLGIEHVDSELDADYLIQKLIHLRIFGDDEGKMNLSVSDISGDLLIVSQFTLFADTKKGNRPSFIRSARPEQARPLYDYFLSQLKKSFSGKIENGVFGANMLVELINDGPVTIIIDSKDL